MKKTLLLAAGLLLAGSAFAQDEQPITTQPEGTLRTFHGYSMACYSEWGFETSDAHDGLARQVVFADNGDVYFKDPLSKAPKGTWIKGTLKDGIITVETPQVIDITTNSAGEPTTWYVQRLKGTPYYDDWYEEWDIEWEFDTENTAITYTFDGNNIVQTEENVKLGLVSGGKMMIYGDYNVVYTAVDETAAKLPEDGDVEKWSFFYNQVYGNQIDVVVDGNDMYIKGFWAAQPAAAIKAEIDGDKVRIPSKQYLGFMNGYYVYLMSAVLDDESYWDVYTTSAEDIVFDYDAEKKSMTLSSDLMPVVRYGKTEGVDDASVLAAFKGLSISYIDQIGRPCTPEIKRVVRYMDTGWGYIEPLILPKDENGNALDVNYLYYCVWMDGEVYVIDPADAIGTAYEGVEEPMTEVAYTFDNTHGISKSGSDSQKYLRFYNVVFNEIGAQSIYYNPETGKRDVSPIMYYDMETGETRVQDVGSGVIAAFEDAEVSSVEYFDLAGNKVDANYKGIFVKIVNFTNGSKKVAKMISK